MKRWCVLTLASLVALPVAAGGILLRGGISARPQPSRLEAAAARAARRWLIPAATRNATNPLSPSPRVIAEGRAHFADHCASCHGNDGSGQTAMGRGLYPRAPDMRLPGTQELADGELFYIIENGIRFTGMPAWGKDGAPEESWKLVHFIRRLPRLPPEELGEMERMNPRSAAEWEELKEDERFLEGGEPPSGGAAGEHYH
jgi:mono/diheme cytochrome c family protein